MFNCCLVHLIDQSWSSGWTRTQQTTVIRASAAEVYLCKQKWDLLGFKQAVGSAVYEEMSKISSEFRGERFRGENRTSRWTTPGDLHPPPVSEQQGAQATFNPDSPNQMTREIREM